MLYYDIPYCTILYYTVLHYTILQFCMRFYTVLLMDKILHDPKDPKLWELWYIPYNG